MAEEAKKWNFNATQSVLTVGKKLKLVAKNSKERLEKKYSDPIRKVHIVLINFYTHKKNPWKKIFYSPSTFSDIILGR